MNKFVLRKSCRHIAFIMDGNGRWAKKRLLPRHLGHKEGIKRVSEIAEECMNLGIECMTLYAFSTENWNRPKDEIDHLFKYFEEFFDSNFEDFLKKDIRIRTMGDISKLPSSTRERINDIVYKSSNNKRFTLNICLNYGGQQEIVRACQQIALQVKNDFLKVEDINIDNFKNYLYSEGLPDIDLMIRTSGEVRLSNYLLYQLAYSEFIFTPTYWPDFTKDKLHECLKEYELRDRRFGSIK